MNHSTRDEVLGRLAEAAGSVTVAHPTRVAIDGPPAAGKTTLAGRNPEHSSYPKPPGSTSRYPNPPKTHCSLRFSQ